MIFNIINRGIVLGNIMFKRILAEGTYLTIHNTTIRDVAKNFNVSKSTVHKDLKERLPKIDGLLAKKVSAILEHNYLTRHIRGGEKTRQKYQRLK